MLTEIYIEALLVDEELADQIWERWDKGEIDDQVAWLVWLEIADRPDNVATIRSIKLATLITLVTTHYKQGVV